MLTTEQKVKLFDFIQWVAEMQKQYPEIAEHEKEVCNLYAPFRDAYKLSDSVALHIVRKQVGLNALIQYGKKAVGIYDK